MERNGEILLMKANSTLAIFRVDLQEAEFGSTVEE